MAHQRLCVLRDQRLRALGTVEDRVLARDLAQVGGLGDHPVRVEARHLGDRQRVLPPQPAEEVVDRAALAEGGGVEGGREARGGSGVRPWAFPGGRMRYSYTQNRNRQTRGRGPRRKGPLSMKMRELEKRTGVNRETIRVYLREGLLPQPLARPNVADYGEEHVRGIQAIRDLQRDGRVPLARIRRAVEGDASAPARRRDRRRATGGAGFRATRHRATAGADREAGGREFACRFRRSQAPSHRRRDAATREGPPGAESGRCQISSSSGVTCVPGFTESAGFTPAVVRIYVESAERLAKLESKTFFDTLFGRSSEVAATRMAEQALSTMLAFFGLVRMKALRLQFQERVSEPHNQSKVRPGKRKAR